MREQLPEDRLVAVIHSIDDGLATVHVGADEVEFLFPVDLLPADAKPGTQLYVVSREGRLEVVGTRTAKVSAPHAAIEDRLDRGLNRMRLQQLGS